MKKLFVILVIVGTLAVSAFKGDDHRPPPSCQAGAVDQYVITNSDGSATAYCVYGCAPTCFPQAEYTLACDYCVWQPVSPP